MHLRRVHLHSFKGFNDFSLDCSQFTVLVGANSSGKTSILQAISLLHEFCTFVFGGQDGFSVQNPRWMSDPTTLINRASPGDPEAIWLDKKTHQPCSIAAVYTDSVELRLEITS